MKPSVKKLLLFGSTAPYSGALIALDFVGSRTSGQPYYMLNGVNYPSVSGVPGWTYTGGASTGCYAARLDGSLQFFPQNVPRITDAGYWPEEARTNLLTYSQQFDNASWTVSATTVTANAAAAPDGTSTADLLIPTVTSTNHVALQNATHTAASYTVSLYAKPAGYDRIGIRENTTSGAYVVASLTGSGSILANSVGTSTITALANGWYRVTMTWTASALSQQLGFYVVGPGYTSGSPHAYSWSGDGTSGVYFWNAQDELGSFATSPIPTTSVAVTRAADVGYVSGLVVPSAATFASRYVFPNNAARRYLWDITDGGLNRLSGRGADSGGSNPSYVIGNGTSVGTLSSVSAFTLGDVVNSGLSYGPDGSVTSAASWQGASVVTSAVGSVAATVGSKSFYIGSNASSSSQLNAPIRRIVIYPRAFGNAELQAITTAGAY